MATKKNNRVHVNCWNCGKPLGTVSRKGHRQWLCETCNPGREVIPVNYNADENNDLTPPEPENVEN